MSKRSIKKVNMKDPLTPYGNRPMVTPIVNSVNYEYESFEVLRQITDGEVDGYTYHRDDNPTVRAVEKTMTVLEGAQDAIVCTTGMAACTMVFLTYLSAGDNLVIYHDVYGANYKVSLILERMGIDITWLNACDSSRLSEYIKDNTKMIFMETPTNPLCKVIDIQESAKIAKKCGAMLVVDNTFSTPYHQQPLSLGADLVIHSATKGLGGHNDLMAGVIACPNKKLYDDLWFTRQAIGTTLDAYSASLLERGLKTFEMRAEKMATNAYEMANYLKDNPKISKLHYPGLPGDDGYETAKKQMKNGFGGMMAFNVGENIEDAKNFISSLEVIFHAVSLGSTETLICIPYLTTMLYLPEERRLSFGVQKNTIRLSAGIEDPSKLIEDLKQALAKV
jgi:cystathionine gamma-lyase / homocysteine desulfhydrase